VAKRKQPYRYGVPAKYLEGLSDAAAKKRAAEIKRTAKAYKLGKKVNIKKVQKSRVSDKKKRK
jgi:hypothetical protein|tara:strand:- start:44 stop:232 length:189 start_codon:yes stop_codon:yes gene_type:complete